MGFFHAYHGPTKILPNFEMRRNMLKCSADGLPALKFVYLFNSTWLLKFNLQRHVKIGGEGEIRTHEAREGLAVFKTAAFNHSATSPSLRMQRSANIRSALRIFNQISCKFQRPPQKVCTALFAQLG